MTTDFQVPRITAEKVDDRRGNFTIEPLDKGDCELVLRSGARVPCSRQHRPALLARLDPARPT